MTTSTPISIGRKHPDAECESCPLNIPEATYVPSEGNRSADIVIVGEAPGYLEVKTGKPFTGPSGKLLDHVLDDHGVKRKDCYTTNVCLCKPGATGKDMPKAAIKACWPRLKKEILDVNPDSILCLGNTAAQTVLDSRAGITSLRSGPPKHSPHFPDAKVVATVHPAACIRSSDMFPSMVSDIGKLVSKVSLGWEEPNYAVFDEAETAIKAIKELQSKYEVLVVDIEVGIEKDIDFGHPEQYQMLCIGFAYARNRACVIGEHALMVPSVQSHLRRLLETKKLVAHNGKFDIAGLRDWGKGTLYFDTMLASYCVDERSGVHGLKYLASEILGAPDYDSELKKYVGKGSYATAPRDILYKYNAYDVVCTWGLYEYYTDRLARENLRELHDFLVLAANELMHLEMGGINVDVEYLNYLTVHYLDDLEDLEKQLQEIAGHGFNPRSPKQVKEYLESIGIKIESTDVTSLRELFESGKAQEFTRLMLEQRREHKLYGTYVKGTRSRLYEGRVHPTFLLHGTVTGRLACRNPNMQNVPRESKIRKLFVPAEGNIFVQADYAQAELRVMAALSQDVWLKEVFDSERDLHSEVAEKFFGPGFTKEQRIRAKAVVFGLAYGREAYSLAQEFKIPVPEAQHYLNTFFESIPQLAQWREDIKNQILSGSGDLVSPFGRNRRFWFITEENKKDVVKEGLSFLPQSIASDICLSALCRLREKLGDKGQIRLPVHDSILVECAIDDADEIALILKTTMEGTAREVFTDYVKFPVDIAIGNSWGDL